MVDKAVAVNDETCEVHLNKPFNALLYTLAVIGIVPDGGHDADYGSNPVAAAVTCSSSGIAASRSS